MKRAKIRGATWVACLGLGLAAGGCQLVLDFAPLPDGGSGFDAGPGDANVALCDEAEPNETLATGFPIVSPLTLQAAICPAGDRDFYSFNLDGFQDISVSLTFPSGSGDLELALHNIDNAQTVTVSTGTDQDEDIEHSANLGNRLESGSYAIEVYGRNDSEVVNYTVDVQISVSDEPDAGLPPS